jgi:hypothetical protein
MEYACYFFISDFDISPKNTGNVEDGCSIKAL